MVAVAETHAETGVRCTVRQSLGSRMHPVTGVVAECHACEYLMGEATNRDPLENEDLAWVPISALSKFIPTETMYPSIASALEAA